MKLNKKSEAWKEAKSRSRAIKKAVKEKLKKGYRDYVVVEANTKNDGSTGVWIYTDYDKDTVLKGVGAVVEGAELLKYEECPKCPWDYYYYFLVK
jgi:hypothetical protein